MLNSTWGCGKVTVPTFVRHTKDAAFAADTTELLADIFLKHVRSTGHGVFSVHSAALCFRVLPKTRDERSKGREHETERGTYIWQCRRHARAHVVSSALSFMSLFRFRSLVTEHIQLKEEVDWKTLSLTEPETGEAIERRLVITR